MPPTLASRRRGVVVGLAFAFVAIGCERAMAQQPQQPQQRGSHRSGALGPNAPDPVQTETTIPFTVGDSTCTDGGRQHVVAIRIYNILGQLVAIPTLVAAAGRSPGAGGPPRARTLRL